MKQVYCKKSEGAACVFLDQFKNKTATFNPLLCASPTVDTFMPPPISPPSHTAPNALGLIVLYFVDARQSLHFKQIFAVAKAAGFASEQSSLEHLPFGTMLGKDGKPFKTRQGGIIKLAELLDEAERRAAELVREKIRTSAPINCKPCKGYWFRCGESTLTYQKPNQRLCV